MSSLNEHELSRRYQAILDFAAGKYGRDDDWRLMRWIDKNTGALRSAIAHALDSLPGEERERESKPERSREELREDLDLTPPSSASKMLIRPPAPMTLGDVRRLAGIPVPNPAPMAKVAARYGSTPKYPRVQGDNEYGEAWALSAPEGFPPYPRRGGEYNETEAKVVAAWLENMWPAWQELIRYARRRDRELLLAGVDPHHLMTIITGRWSGESLEHFIRSYSPSSDTSDTPIRTPKDVVERMEKYARKYMPYPIRLLDALRDPKAAWKARGGAEADKQAEWAAQNGFPRNGVFLAYGLRKRESEIIHPEFFSEPWRTRLRGMAGEEYGYAHWDLKTPDGTLVPLSAHIEADRNQRTHDHEAFTARDGKARDHAAALHAELQGQESVNTPWLKARGWDVDTRHHVIRDGLTVWTPKGEKNWTGQLIEWASRPFRWR